MRRLILVLLSMNIFGNSLEMTIDGIKQDALGLLIAVCPEDDKSLMEVAQLLKQNLQRSDQFRVVIRACELPTTTVALKKGLDKNYPLTLFLSQADDTIEWRLYDVHDGAIIKGKRCKKRGSLLHGYADNLADELWPVLTKQPSSFTSKIAYVKRKGASGKKPSSVVCIAHSDGTHEQELIKTPGTYVSLYWHQDKEHPCLFCSEFTRFNVRFISVGLNGSKRVVLNVEGTCVGISVAHKKNKAVYCRSGNIWHYGYDPKEKKSLHSVLIANEGKNVSPTLLENGDVIFCSDARSLKKGYPKATGPQICLYKDGAIELLTDEGYNVGPSYCPSADKIAYSKKIDGLMQLCILDRKTKKEEQVTFDAGNKVDCCWSPCGNYLLFCYKQGSEKRIAVMHVALKKRTFLTSADEYCTCPSWSPVYETLPVVA